MAQYMDSVIGLTSAGICRIPFRESIVFAMAMAGLFCLGAAAAMALRDFSPSRVPIRIDRE